MPELSPKEYLEYLRRSYGERPDAYYRQSLTVPLRSGEAVLDYGCGLGRMLETVAAVSPASSLAGVDLNPECVAFVRERNPDWSLAVLEAPGLSAPFADASFDRVFLLDVLEHVREPARLLAECHRLLRPGGILTLSTPDRLAWQKLAGVHPFGPRSLLFNVRHLLGREFIDPTHVTEWSAAGLLKVLSDSPFRRHDLRPVLWHRVPWLRPPKRYYAFIVNLFKDGD